MKRDFETSCAADGTGNCTSHSLFRRVDTDRDGGVTMPEYMAWVIESQGEAVATNATSMALWVDKFQRYGGCSIILLTCPFRE